MGEHQPDLDLGLDYSKMERKPDDFLAQKIIDCNVVHFGENIRNKNDSPSCLFDPRLLEKSPDAMNHIKERIAKIVKEKCSAKTIMGIEAFGAILAGSAGPHAGRSAAYIHHEVKQSTGKLIEGLEPPYEGLDVTLVDDLVFSGNTIKDAVEKLRGLGIKVPDVITVIDRQLAGPEFDAYLKEQGIKRYSLIKMEEIVEYMQKTNNITSEQLKNLVRDYQAKPRGYMPDFAK